MRSTFSAALLALVLLIPFKVTAAPGEGTLGVQQFGGLYDSDAPAVIPARNSQDCLNVESNLAGTSIKKRKGYSLENTMTVATAPISGSSYFRNASGSDVTVVCNDRNCAGSVNGGNFSNFLTTATASTTRWSFVSADGFLYGANNNHDAVVKYNGSVSSNPASIPACSLLDLTADRMVCANTTANPSRVNYSKAGDFITWATGVNSVDPWNDDIVSAGDQITALKHRNGIEYIFKSRSIVACSIGDQYTTTCQLVTDQLGITSQDANSISVTPGGILFKGSDLNYWMLNGMALDKISQNISVLVSSQPSGTSRVTQITDQSDWEAGTQNPTASWLTTPIPGSIIPATVTWIPAHTTESEYDVGVNIYPTSSTLTAITASTWTSVCFDLGYSTPIWTTMTSIEAGPGAGLTNYYIRTGTACVADVFPPGSTKTLRQPTAWSGHIEPDSLVPSTYTSRYVQLQVVFRQGAGQNVSITSTTLISATTGQFSSACISLGASISSFGLFSCDATTAFGGGLTFETRSAASCGALGGSWTSQTNNTAVAVSVNPAIQIRVTDTLTSSTATARLDACSIYWNEGSLPSPSWALYDGTRNYAYWTTQIGTSTTNNRVLKYDLNLKEWYPFSLNATALSILNNSIYAGSSTGGYWTKYGSAESDNGSAINAYWKSKDFNAGDPFVERTHKNLSVLARNTAASSMSVSWATGRASSGTYSVSLSTTSAIPYIRSNYNLPLMSPNSFFNFQVGNNAANQPFEVMGIKTDFYEYPWRVLTP